MRIDLLRCDQPDHVDIAADEIDMPVDRKQDRVVERHIVEFRQHEIGRDTPQLLKHRRDGADHPVDILRPDRV
ncbi:hypothetical protein D3C72_2364660 [compost metagenome]